MGRRKRPMARGGAEWVGSSGLKYAWSGCLVTVGTQYACPVASGLCKAGVYETHEMSGRHLAGLAPRSWIGEVCLSTVSSHRDNQGKGLLL